MAPFTLIIGNKNYSSWSLRAWLMLKQTGVDFEEIRIPLDTPETRASILRYSPSGKVPALQHGSLHLWESIAIGEYLTEQFPNCQLYPSDRETRAIARAVSAEMHAGFSPLRHHMPMDMRNRYPGRGRAPGVQQDIDRIREIWRTCRTQFGTEGDFLFGSFTLADAMFAPVVSRFVTYGVELDEVCQDYADAVWQFPTMQEWIAAAIAEPETLEV